MAQPHREERGPVGAGWEASPQPGRQHEDELVWCTAVALVESLRCRLDGQLTGAVHLDDHPQALGQGLRVVAGRSETTGAQELMDVLRVDCDPDDLKAVAPPPPICCLPADHPPRLWFDSR